MTFDLMQYIEEESQSTGGGTFVCQAELGVGYIIYEKGSARNDRYFRVTGEEDRDSQKEAAAALAEKLGQAGKFRFCASLYLYADSVLNRDTPTWTQAGTGIWAHDLPVYTDGWKDVLSPSIQANFGNEIPWNEKFWAHINLVPDPYNEKSGRDNRVPQIVAVFETREEAIEAAEELGAPVSGVKYPEQPEMWDEDALGLWKVYCEDVVAHFKEKQDSDGSYYLLPQFGVDSNMIQSLKVIAEEDLIPF